MLSTPPDHFIKAAPFSLVGRLFLIRWKCTNSNLILQNALVEPSLSYRELLQTVVATESFLLSLLGIPTPQHYHRRAWPLKAPLAGPVCSACSMCVLRSPFHRYSQPQSSRPKLCRCHRRIGWLPPLDAAEDACRRGCGSACGACHICIPAPAPSLSVCGILRWWSGQRHDKTWSLIGRNW